MFCTRFLLFLFREGFLRLCLTFVVTLFIPPGRAPKDKLDNELGTMFIDERFVGLSTLKVPKCIPDVFNASISTDVGVVS